MRQHNFCQTRRRPSKAFFSGPAQIPQGNSSQQRTCPTVPGLQKSGKPLIRRCPAARAHTGSCPQTRTLSPASHPAAAGPKNRFPISSGVTAGSPILRQFEVFTPGVRLALYQIFATGTARPWASRRRAKASQGPFRQRISAIAARSFGQGSRRRWWSRRKDVDASPKPGP